MHRTIFCLKSQSKRSRGITSHTHEDNIKIYFRGIDFEGRNWIKLAQDMTNWKTFVNTVINLPVP